MEYNTALSAARSLLNGLEQATLLLDGQGTVLHANPAFHRLPGQTSVIVPSLDDLLDAGAAARLKARCAGATNGHQGAFELELRQSVPLGALPEALKTRARLSGVEMGRTRFFTLQLEMTEVTTSHESLFSSLVEFSPSGMVLVDGQGRILLVNRAVEECFGYSRDELLGKHVEELLPSRLRQGHQSLRQAFLRSPSTRPMGSGRDLYAARKDGSEFPVEVGLNPVPGTEGPEVLAVIVDISERKAMERETARLQEKLQQAQKMESLGVLAGGVAHDFNNLLTGVIGNSDLALLSLPETSPACANLIDIQRTALRAADLCRQMLAYSGRGRFEIKSIDLNGVIEEMLQLLHSNIDSSIQIANKLKSGLPAIEGDPSQVGQVVMNLVLNAAEAMPEGEAASNCARA
ncbi:MAG: PAS domain S-box protein [Candidatus Delongbacteria bacterium]|nr:PAS domain S-box protein [Candidatus Delongbacteria bacterium]